eukprot:1144916-Pelagomonas_calceolata.AAC.10
MAVRLRDLSHAAAESAAHAPSTVLCSQTWLCCMCTAFPLRSSASRLPLEVSSWEQPRPLGLLSLPIHLHERQAAAVAVCPSPRGPSRQGPSPFCSSMYLTKD